MAFIGSEHIRAKIFVPIKGTEYIKEIAWDVVHCIQKVPEVSVYILLAECNSGISQTLPFGVNTTIELKNIKTAPDNTGTLVSLNIPHQMPCIFQCYVYFLAQS